ncbi:MAG: hypothetical protein V1692_00475, partial [bacterium]
KGKGGFRFKYNFSYGQTYTFLISINFSSSTPIKSGDYLRLTIPEGGYQQILSSGQCQDNKVLGLPIVGNSYLY